MDDEWYPALRNAVSMARALIERYSEFIDDDQRKALEDKMERAERALHERDQAGGQAALDELFDTVFGLGVASTLLLVDRLMYNVDPETSQRLAEGSKRLRDAYRAQDFDRMPRIQQALQKAITDVIERNQAGSAIQQHEGLLRTYSGEPSGPGEGRPK
jgi:DNA-binding GntR family transcriptional regulator